MRKMKKGILYLVDEDYSTKAYYREGKEDIPSLNVFIKQLYFDELKDYQTYKKIISKKLNITQLIPLYINDKTLLWIIKNQEATFYINYYEIDSYYYDKDWMVIVFKIGRVLHIKKTYSSYLRDIKRIKQILHYLDKMKI